jgi:hypothetical protein
MLRVTVHQPNLIPRAKVLQKIAASDLWVVLDDVQFNPRDHQHRAFIVPTLRDQNAHWLTVPVSTPHGRTTTITEVSAARAIKPLYRDALIGCFGESPQLTQLIRDVESAYRADDCLVSLGVAATQFLLKCSRVPMPAVARASDLRSHAMPKSHGIMQLLTEVGATEYVADSGALAYLDADALRRKRIDVRWQTWPALPLLDLTASEVRKGTALNVWIRDVNTLRQLLTAMSATWDASQGL